LANLNNNGFGFGGLLWVLGLFFGVGFGICIYGENRFKGICCLQWSFLVDKVLDVGSLWIGREFCGIWRMKKTVGFGWMEIGLFDKMGFVTYQVC
jgi:hypothetical protein